MTSRARHEPEPDPRSRAGIFATTRWSLVAALDPRRESAAQASLTELCLRYWYPVYAHVRRSGHSPAQSQDFTRAFFERMIAAGAPAEAPPQQGRFRTWLLDRLNAFLGADGQSASPIEMALDSTTPASELEARVQAESDVTTASDAAFQRSFALEVLTQAFKRLRKEAQDAQRLDMFAELEPYLSVDPPPGRYEELGRSLTMQPIAVVMALKRLRGRFRELVDAELADTVTTQDEFRAERDALRAVLEEAR